MTDFLFDPEHIGVFSPPISTTNQQLVDRLGFEKEFLTDKLGFTGCRHVSADNPVTFLAKAAVADLKLKDTELDTSKIECLVFVTQTQIKTCLPPLTYFRQSSVCRSQHCVLT